MKKSLLLMLLLALLAPWTAKADELLVADATGTNAQIPIYGLYTDDYYQHTQTIYPASMLTQMQGCSITKLTYYLKAACSDAWGATFQVRLGTTTQSSFESGTVSYISLTGSANYTGVINNTNSNKLIEITLSTPYTYTSGNLVVDVRLTTLGSGYEGKNFYGESGSTCYSVRNRSESSVPTSTGTAVTFMPKTQFTYTAAVTAPTVTTGGYSNLTSTSVTLEGTIDNMGGASSVTAGICLSTTNPPTTSNTHLESNYTGVGSYSKDFTGLTPNTRYYYRAFAYNSANSLSNPSYGSNVYYIDIPAASTCEDFNSFSGASSGYNSAGSLPTGWDQIYNGTVNSTESVAPHVHNGGTPGTGSGDNALSGNYLGFYAANGTMGYAIMPAVASNKAVNHLSFKYNFESSSSGTLTYGVINGTNESSYEIIGTLSSPSSNPGIVDVDLNVNQTIGKRIAFRWYKESTWYTCGIDDICYTTQNVTTYTVSTTVSPAGSGSVTGGGIVISGASCTVTATSANSDFISFVNWTENGSVVSTSASYTFTVNGNRNLVANFASVCDVYEGFEGVSGASSNYDVAGSLPTGWDRIYNGTVNSTAANAPHVHNGDTPGAPSTGYYLGFYSSGSDSEYSYAIMPAFAANLTPSHISFKYKLEAANQGDLTYGVITGTDASTYVALCDGITSASGTIDEDITASDIAGKRLAFCWHKSSTWYTAAIDDICVELSESVPLKIVASNPASDEMTWDQFVNYVNNGHSFAGETVTLMADITGVNTMAGTDAHPFSGTFEGNEHSISVSLGTSSSPITVQGAAPFRYISDATIQNLTVTGNVYTNQHHAAGLVGFAADGSINTIQNCHVSTNVTNGNAYNGDSGNNFIGGLIGHNMSATLIVEGCIYDGTLTSQGFKGGMVGFGNYDSYVTIINSYFGGSYSANGYSYGNFSPISCHGSGRNFIFTFSNFYYNTDVTAFSASSYEGTVNASYTTDGRAKHAYSITGVDPVTVALSGSANDTYSVSGLAFYDAGFTFGGTIYAGEGDYVELTLSGSTIGYTSNHGTLEDNILVMAAYDTEISAEDPYCHPAPASIDGNGITNVTFGTSGYVVNNDADPDIYANNSNYANYSSLVGAVEAGTPSTIAITYQTGYDYGTVIWVDLDNSETFEASEILYYGISSDANPTTLNATITIPLLQATGNYRMRIGGADSAFDDVADADPCYTGDWACFQDYTLRVLSASPCTVPLNLNADNITSNSASLSWSGVQSSYNLRYRKAESFVEDFEDETEFESWTFTSMNEENGIGTSNGAGRLSEAALNDSYGFRFSSYNSASDYNQYLISPLLSSVGVVVFNYMQTDDNDTETFAVGYSTTNNSISSFTWTNLTLVPDEWQEYTYNLPSNVKYIAFHYYGDYAFYVYLDDITFTSTYPWQTVSGVTSPRTISGLESATLYQWQVQGVNSSCSGGVTGWSNTSEFTTESGYAVTATVAPEGVGTVSGTGTYAIGTDAVVSATCTNANYIFAYWEDQWSTGSTYYYYYDNPHTIGYIEEGHALVAHFAPINIGTTTQWDEFCDAVNHGFSYQGQTVNLTANVGNVTTMAGVTSGEETNPDSDNAFRGTFDGHSYTLTVNLNSNGADDQNFYYCAPFRKTWGATIQNLKVAGTISTVKQGAGGIGGLVCSGTFTNCASTVAITNNYGDDATTGGLVAVTRGSTTFTGCAFQGSFTSTNSTSKWGGFVGWNSSSVTLTNCVFDPSGLTGLGSTGCSNFVRANTGLNISNCYYTQAIGSSTQGKQRYFVGPGSSNVSVAMRGTETTYGVSGIKAYEGSQGLRYYINNDDYYIIAGYGDQVRLTVNYTGTVGNGYYVTYTTGSSGNTLDPNTGDNGSNTLNTNLIMATSSDTFIYGTLTASSFDITVEANPSVGGTVEGGGTYNNGAAVEISATANEGYSFQRWTKNGEQVATTSSYSFTATENATYTANFTLNQHTLTIYYQYADNTEASTTYTHSYDYHASYSVTSPTIPGYTASTAIVSGIMPDEDVTVTVTYGINSYLLTINYLYADNTEAAPSYSQSYNYNASYSVTSPVIEGYTANTPVVSGTMGTSAVTVNVVYTINTYTITVTPVPSTSYGTVTGGGTYTHGQTVTVTATPAQNTYVFVNWTRGNASGAEVMSTNATYQFTATENINLVAHFDFQPPQVVTDEVAVANITNTNAGVSGSITTNGSIYSYGFCWSSTNSTPTTSDSQAGVGAPNTHWEGAFSYTIPATGSLASNTLYYLRAYAAYPQGTAYGNVVTFTTQATATQPTVNSYLTTSANVTGGYTTDGNESITGCGFVYGTTNNPTIGNGTQVAMQSVSASFNADITGLTGNTTYYVRSYVTNAGGTNYGPVTTVTTLPYYPVTANVVPATYGSVTFNPAGIQASEAQTVQIGTDSISANITSFLPIYTSSSNANVTNSFAEMIYEHTSAMTEGDITSISFLYSQQSNGNLNHSIDIYLTHTTKTAFTSNTDFVPVTSEDRYFHGTFVTTSNVDQWFTIELDEPFHYNGEDNIVVGVDFNGVNGITPDYRKWYYTATTNVTCLCNYSTTNSDVDPANPSSGSTSLYTRPATREFLKQRPNIKFTIEAANSDTHYYAYGDDVELTAVPASADYVFSYWTIDGSTTSTTNPYTIQDIAAAHSLTANFSLSYNKRFVVDGNWNEDNNWLPVGAPTLNDKVRMDADAVITGSYDNVDYVATADNIIINTGSITIEDGGQLWHNNADLVTMTIENDINGYTAAEANTNKGYEILSFPVDNLTAGSNTITGVFTADPYDFYRFDASVDPLEWVHMTSNSTISLLQGFIYASQEGTTISVTGPVMSSATPVSSDTVAYVTENAPRFNGWALLGNPFVCNAYVSLGTGDGAGAEANFYKLYNNTDYDEFIPFSSGDAVTPMGGVMFRVYDDDNIVYSRTAPSKGTGILNMDVRKTTIRGTSTLDRARVRFGEGRNLHKFQFDTRHTKIYIPEGNEDFSVYYAEGAGTIPVNFKAQDNGRYTLDFSTEDVEFNYLHLIDNMNGSDVDLLQTPYYTFDAKATDFASRFTLVFATGNDNGETFAFFNNGVWIINNDGEAVLQVVDALGRILSSENITGSCSKAINAAPGVYMLRLINGDNVKVQKIIVNR